MREKGTKTRYPGVYRIGNFLDLVTVARRPSFTNNLATSFAPRWVQTRTEAVNGF